MAQNINNNINNESGNNNNNNINDNDTVRRPLSGYVAPPAPENFENILLNNFVEADEDLFDGRENAGIAANQQQNQTNDNNGSHEPNCWVFGYGSLCWYPGFTYSKCITGYIRGYVRRFWQGSTAHRGTVERPGRVATLVKDKEGITWGCAYRITGDTALDYLKKRECTLGGYATLEMKFFPRVATTPFNGEAIVVLAYIATPDNRLWLGDDTPEHISNDIAECRGPTGHNAEYLLRLAEFIHEVLPDVVDENLFELERLVLENLEKRQIPLSAVMGATPERIRRDSHDDLRRPPSFEFTARVPERKLRCLNI